MEKEERTFLASLELLRKREAEVCKALDIRTKQISEDKPLRRIIDEFNTYVTDLENERFEREERFCRVKPIIQDLVKSLHFKPSLDFERIVIGEDDMTFIFSNENMDDLEKFYKSLKGQDDKIGEELMVMREKLQNLWGILDEDRAKCELFLARHVGNNYDTLEAFKAELRRCEQLKKANIEVLHIFNYILQRPKEFRVSVIQINLEHCDSQINLKF